MDPLKRLRERTASRQPDIVLPESDDLRVLGAGVRLAGEGICRVILLGGEEQVEALNAVTGRKTPPDGVRLLDPAGEADRSLLAPYLQRKREKEGLTGEEVHERLRDPLVFAACLVGSGEADGCVAGAVHPTADVIRAALRYIGMREGVSLVSSIFLMHLPDGRLFTYGDCGVVPYPDAGELAGIALESARSHRLLAGEEPRVALLSFSTKGSAEHERTLLVREALQMARERDPELAIDGELQFDAALLPEVAEKKAPGSPVAGNANVFIFPNLDAGNIGYKITERLAGAQATGPILQGLALPMMDLSRGCSEGDILHAACVASVMGE